jgi:hypothetical protein
MTPKEKAIELVYEFDEYSEARISNNGRGFDKKYCSKQCALIAVKEIYKLDLIPGQYPDDCKNKTSYFSYWEEVMEEIQKL